MANIQHVRILGIALWAGMHVTSAYAQTDKDDQQFTDPIHADLPIFGDETSDKWPQPFSDQTSGDFGCSSRVAFGGWVMRASGEDGDDDATWYRFVNYGVFHCYALVGTAGDQEGLEGAELKPSFFVFLGRSGNVEIWAVQIGARTGGDYLLLSREPASGIISNFSVLQRRCEKRNVRDAGPIDILLTRYCTINSRAELFELARRMVKLKS